MSELMTWLQREVKTAENYFEQAAEAEKTSGYTIDRTIERAYWEGYLDGTINAQAAITGPTPLEGGE